jgi:hypothetical protein
MGALSDDNSSRGICHSTQASKMSLEGCSMFVNTARWARVSDGPLTLEYAELLFDWPFFKQGNRKKTSQTMFHTWCEIILEAEMTRGFSVLRDVHTWGFLWHIACRQPSCLNLENYVTPVYSGIGAAEVACWPLIPKFAGSSPAEGW